MPDERFALLVNLGKKITDYAMEKDMGGDGRSFQSLFCLSFIACLYWLLHLLYLQFCFLRHVPGRALLRH